MMTVIPFFSYIKNGNMHFTFKFSPIISSWNIKNEQWHTQFITRKHENVNRDTIYQGKVKNHIIKSWVRTFVFKLCFTTKQAWHVYATTNFKTLCNYLWKEINTKVWNYFVNTLSSIQLNSMYWYSYIYSYTYSKYSNMLSLKRNINWT